MTANLPNGMRRKLVLQTDQAEDAELIQSLLDWMQSAGADFTNTFRDLSDGPPDQPTRPTVRSPPRRLGMIQETHERIAQSTGAEEETFGRISGLVRRPAHNEGPPLRLEFQPVLHHLHNAHQEVKIGRAHV